MSDNIKVVVKVRPLISREIEDKLPLQWRVSNNTLYQIDGNGRECGQSYTFDKVYSENCNITEVYDDIAKPIVEAATAGFNGTIFAYGQTSSGKTYTMTGTKESPGIIQLAVLNLFDIISSVPDRDFLVRVSYMEIYNDSVKDLLDIKRENLKIHENLDGNIRVDVTEKVTSSPDEILEAMKEGNVNRQTGATNMNEKSSRSHSIFQITIESREHVEGEEKAGCVNVAQLNLVDLAGSERADQTGATGQRFKEGTHINKSLFSLTRVIKQLSEGPTKHASYRDSKLTRILQNSLGGNAMTTIICAITPAALEETISTLKFATRAKAVKNKPEVNAVTTDATMIQKLTEELSKLQKELYSKKNLELMLENKKQVELELQKRIKELKRVIIHGFMSGPTETRRPPARRVTISALHSSETSVAPAPRFATPALKYNPMMIAPNPIDFVPIQTSNSRRLPSLPEEPRCIVTPTQDKNINYNDEIIELDSDDDIGDCATLPTCSPYHKCRDTSKTPPCKLRQTTKEAEKNLKDIMEFTEMEKIYSPSVVELLQKLEQCSNEKVKLNEDMELLKNTCKEKDREINTLKGVLTKAEDDVKQLNTVKSDLESQCKKLTTKLTEWEVMYETLQKKAKLREAELLSLLEEQKHKDAEDIGKVPYKQMDKEIVNFMDMSKDISLVNSDNESSVINTDDDQSSQIQDLVKELQNQLENKSKIIVELEANLKIHKDRIDSMEKSNQDILKTVDNCKEELSYLENENKILKSTVKTLNSTINSQKKSIESADTDLKSCYDVIKELQIKLGNNTLNKEPNDSLIDTLIETEEKTIANNDNIRNIIHSLKLAIDTRNKEVNKMKETIRLSNEKGSKMEIDIKEKTAEIDRLHEELSKVNAQVSDNINIIDKLMHDKILFGNVEQELTNKVVEYERKNSDLENNTKQNLKHIENMTKLCEDLKIQIAQKIESETANIKLIEDLNKTLVATSTKIVELEKIIENKEELLKILEDKSQDSHNYVENAKQALVKVQNLFLILSGEVQEIPELIDSLISAFNVLTNSLNDLENIALMTVTERDSAVKEVDNLKNKHAEELKKLQIELENVNKIITEERANHENDKDKIRNEMSGLKLRLIKDIEQDVQNRIRSVEETYRQIIIKKQEEIDKMAHKIDAIENKLINHSKKLESNLKEEELSRKFVVKNVVEKLNNLVEFLDIESALTHGDEESCKIFTTLDKTIEKVRHIINFNSEMNEMLLTVENENDALRSQIANDIKDKTKLNESLFISKELFEQVKEELQVKSLELTEMEERTKEWKEQFLSLDLFMKQQIQDLQNKNEVLNNKLVEIKRNTAIQVDILNESDLKDSEKIKKSLQTSNNIVKESPRSLLTICCDRILELIDSKTDESNTTSSTTPSTSDTTIEKDNTKNCAKCKVLSEQLEDTKQKNAKLMGLVEKLEVLNNDLLVEQENIKGEIQQLVEPAIELHKKIQNHKTNLSILTATTYAENKSLKLQVKGLQHHHVRFHNVCERDIPEFKNQLCKLMTILKGDPSFSDSINFTMKRYSMPNVLSNDNNESTLDGDMLMLDTNITLTTADNTLVGYDQTCHDLTQTFTETCDNNIIDNGSNGLENQMEVLQNDNQKMFESLECLQNENRKLKALLEKYPNQKLDDTICVKCAENKNATADLAEIKQKLTKLESEKEEYEMKYNNLLLEMPSTDGLVRKISNLEKDHINKEKELVKIKNALDSKNKEILVLRDENDSLSSQVMDAISETDDLNKELDRLKQENLQLVEKLQALESKTQMPGNDMTDLNSHSRLNRSLSDSDTSSRMNKISTLQSELHAGREDCKVLTEDVATIKHHLDCSNMSVDMDDSDLFTLAQEYVQSPQPKKCSLPEITEEPFDTYKIDKQECYNYYVEQTGSNKEINEFKIIELMKLLHDNIITKYNGDVENLNKKLKDYEESETGLKCQISNLSGELNKLKQVLDDNDRKLELITKIRQQLKESLKVANEDLTNGNDIEKAVNQLKVNFLTVLDANFSIVSVNVFETVFNKYKSISEETQNNCVNLQNRVDILSTELNKSEETLVQLKNELQMKHDECSEKEIKLINLLKDSEKLKDVNNNTIIELTECNAKFEALKLAHDNLNKNYESKIKENINNLNEIDKLTEEINNLKEVITSKEETILKLSASDNKTTELLEQIKILKDNIEHLKSVNEIVIKEKESCLSELSKSCDTIKQNNIEMDKMSSDILVLRESLKEATEIIDNLKFETSKLSRENGELKINLEDKTKACSRLQTNIKTHEKTAEIQSRMIVRLKKLKEEDDISLNDKQLKINELSEKHTALLQEHEELKESLNQLKEEMGRLKTAKENLEQCVSELQSESGHKSRLSMDAIAESSRRRRQSLYDSKRMFEQLEDEKNMEAVFESRQKADDLFMDVDFDMSGRSSQNRGRDSIASKRDQSDNDEDPPSRPSSVLAIRRRRQSIHDLHRSGVRNTPSPHDVSNVISEAHNGNGDKNSEINSLKEQLSNCQQELEELKIRFREVDEECETCAEYLKERDEQCIRLKKEKVALEQQLNELKKSTAVSNRNMVDVSVNTDEDWANLHAVVVDRMSYDAEVEKNKKLTKTIEELRFKKQDLQNTMAKMQKALEKSAAKDCSKELEATKEELNYCKVELEELRVRYKELDEECETCAEYLRERDEECKRLKEAKSALEKKLKEYQEDSHLAAHSHSVRKKRQTIHDMNRQSVIDQSDATTETSEDLLSYQVERDSSKVTDDTSTQQLKMLVEALTKQKAALEHQLRAMQVPNNPMYVATGSAIVQNQQITDVMKENQRLKKINSKLVNICKKRGKNDPNRENTDPCDENIG